MFPRNATGWRGERERESDGGEERGKERSSQSTGSEPWPGVPGLLVEPCPSSLKTRICSLHFPPACSPPSPTLSSAAGFLFCGLLLEFSPHQGSDVRVCPLPSHLSEIGRTPANLPRGRFRRPQKIRKTLWPFYFFCLFPLATHLILVPWGHLYFHLNQKSKSIEWFGASKFGF